MLTRKNVKQAAAFWRNKDVMNVQVTHGGVTYTSLNMLSSTGPQPLRFTMLDCFQEGSYDWFGTLPALSPRLQAFVAAVADGWSLFIMSSAGRGTAIQTVSVRKRTSMAHARPYSRSLVRSPNFLTSR